VSAASPLPRFLAELLGVEQSPAVGRRAGGALPPPSGAARAVVPAAPAASADAGDGRERAVRRPVAGTEQSGSRAGAAADRRAAEEQLARSVPVRSDVRRAVSAPSALRSAVVVAELLGPPRAIRPYGRGGHATGS
jgi:hypothetical protein